MKRLLCLVALSATVFGCTVTTDPAPGPAPAPTPVPIPVSSDGQLVLDWSINGDKDPNLCFQSSAATLEVTIFFDSGASAGTFEQSCTAFATTITLAAGRYTASALLLDGSAQPRTTAIAIDPFVLRGDDSISVPIDFPSDSFF